METTDPLEIGINFRFLLHWFKDIVVDRGALWPYIFIFKNRLKKHIFQLPTPLSCSRFWHKNGQIPPVKFPKGGNFAPPLENIISCPWSSIVDKSFNVFRNFLTTMEISLFQRGGAYFLPITYKYHQGRIQK